MDLALTLKAVAALSGAGLFMGLVLAIASKRFHVEEDPKVKTVLDILPGTNCGACGYPGCRVAAEAIAREEAEVDACTAGGHDTAKHVAEALGKEAGEAKDRVVAVLKCEGGVKHTKRKFEYDVLHDCDAAHSFMGGNLKCAYGCLGYGNCERECPFDAIKMEEGLPVVDYEKCTGCGICVSTCVRDIFELITEKAHIYVGCNSLDKGHLNLE